MNDRYASQALNAQQTSIRAITAKELLSSTIPARRLLMEPWLPESGLAMIYAPRGVGKTHLALTVSYAIASGSSVLGWKAPAPTPALYVDGEMPQIALQQRLSGITAGNSAKLPSEDYLRFLSADACRDGIPDLATTAGQQVILDNLGSARVVVFDNLSTLTRVKENEGDDWVSMQHFLLALRRKGIAVILIHHAGRNGQARGTSRREDILDTVISLKRPDDYEANQGARFVVVFEKARGFTGAQAEPIEATLFMDPITDATSWKYGAPSNNSTRAMEMFADGHTVRDVIDELGVAKATAYRWHKEFRSKG